METNDFRENFLSNGHVWLRSALTPKCLESLRLHAATGDKPGARVTQDGALFQEICDASFSHRLAQIWPGMRPERVVVFNKTAQTNWALPWHQDRVVAMERKIDAPGFTNWTRKAGMWHCEPPERILRRMLFVRVHLDDVTVNNGAMEIAVGSHRLGRISKAGIEPAVGAFEHEVIEAAAGDVLVLSMLTLHRSLPSKSKEARRALRIDYASAA